MAERALAQDQLDRAALKWLTSLAPISPNSLRVVLRREEGFTLGEASGTVERLVHPLGWAEADDGLTGFALTPTAYGWKASRGENVQADRAEESRLAWLKAVEDMANEADHLAASTPYGFARYGGRLKACRVDGLQDLADDLRKDSEASL